MASRVKQAAVDALPAQLQAVFRTLRSEQWTTNMEALMQLKDVGKNVTLAQVDHWAEELRSRGFINTDETHGRLRYKRAEIITEARPTLNKPPAPPVQTPEQRLLNVASGIAAAAVNIESLMTAMRERTAQAQELIEEIVTRPEVVPPVTLDELAVLKEKAKKWDELQNLMGRG